MDFEAQNHYHRSLLFPNKIRSLKELLLQRFPQELPALRAGAPTPPRIVLRSF
jgi:hypothetical protein